MICWVLGLAAVLGWGLLLHQGRILKDAVDLMHEVAEENGKLVAGLVLIEGILDVGNVEEAKRVVAHTLGKLSEHHDPGPDYPIGGDDAP